MQLQDIWSGFSKDQYRYITHIIKNSDARSICELGTFVGTTAKHVWNSIKDTDKKLYLVDNYFFLPKEKREKFFNTVKHSIDAETNNIITVMEDSHTYDWTKHNFVIFGHHDAGHMLPDLKKLLNSDVDYAIIGDGIPKCFERTKAVFEFLSGKLNHDYEAQYYLNGLIVIGKKNLKCSLPITKNTLFGKSIKVMPKPEGNYLRAIHELEKLY